jgi:hypothetical protein
MTPLRLSIICSSGTGGQRPSDYVDIELFTFTELAAGSWQARSGTTRYRELRRVHLESLPP